MRLLPWIDALRRAGDAAARPNLLQPRAGATPTSCRLALRLRDVSATLRLPAA